MIIWITSYPKSGNTWVRALLSTYLYSDQGNFEFNLLKNIDAFPSKKYFLPLLKNFQDMKKVSSFWLAAQNKINLNDNITFLKTHSALCTFENNKFTDSFNTKAVIYVVRDPRNVITSLSNHYSLDIKESFSFITKKNRMLVLNKYGGSDFGIAEVLGDWSEHYKSWKNITFAPILIIKYEDLLLDTKKTFISVLVFLSKFTKIKIDNKKIENTINTCSFESLVKKEKDEGFNEAVISKKNYEKVRFFNLGKKNDWNYLLDIEYEKKLREFFALEMKELGYI